MIGTVDEEAPVAADDEQPLWASVADGFYVGSRAGVFLGYVDRQPDGLWRAFDAASSVIGDFDDHQAAIETVTAATAIVADSVPGTEEGS